jgi:IS605 OrfB family transposase
MLGVDFNPTGIDWAYCDNQGNLKASGSLRVNIQDRSTNQTKDALGKACAELVRLGESFSCPIVIEKLDFAQKKAALKEHSQKYARMLSSFAYSTFTTLLEARAFKHGIQLFKVNPAYSSLQGLSKFMSMYGLNSGTAAALVLGRRALRFSERLPRAYYNALKKPVDNFRHVWSAWSVVAKLNKGRLRHSFFTPKKGKLTALSRSPHSLFGEVGKEKSTSILGCEPPA